MSNSNNLDFKQLVTLPALGVITEIEALYQAEQWISGPDAVKTIQKIIQGSFAFFIATQEVDQNSTVIGMGRVISDGCSDAYLQDIAIKTEFRGQGIGLKLIQHMITRCQQNEISWIGLIAKPGTEAFYQKLNFQIMPKYTPMLLQK